MHGDMIRMEGKGDNILIISLSSAELSQRVVKVKTSAQRENA